MQKNSKNHKWSSRPASSDEEQQARDRSSALCSNICKPLDVLKKNSE